MSTAAASLPPQSFATGSGVVNMLRQVGLAVGVAMLVAVLGAPGSAVQRLAAFHRGWWVISAIALAGVVPAVLLLRGDQPKPGAPAWPRQRRPPSRLERSPPGRADAEPAPG